jgi:hypothetical protein
MILLLLLRLLLLVLWVPRVMVVPSMWTSTSHMHAFTHMPRTTNPRPSHWHTPWPHLVPRPSLVLLVLRVPAL